MYLSKLILNPRSRAVRRDLADCQNLHRTMLAAFPQVESNSPSSEFTLLYRIEPAPRSGAITAIVQSLLRPNWSCLQEYLLDVADNPACKPIDDIYQTLREGQHLAFRLRANPTRKIDTKTRPDGTRSNGRRVELRGEEDQIAWLQRKGETTGFRLLRIRIDADQMLAVRRLSDIVSPPQSLGPATPNLRTRAEDRVLGWRADRTKQPDLRRLTFGSVLFDGLLEITEVGKFKLGLTTGIGSGKAYGFGLLSIAPVR